MATVSVAMFLRDAYRTFAMPRAPSTEWISGLRAVIAGC
jgi:hypothetical protein